MRSLTPLALLLVLDNTLELLTLFLCCGWSSIRGMFKDIRVFRNQSLAMILTNRVRGRSIQPNRQERQEECANVFHGHKMDQMRKKKRNGPVLRFRVAFWSLRVFYLKVGECY